MYTNPIQRGVTDLLWSEITSISSRWSGTVQCALFSPRTHASEKHPPHTPRSRSLGPFFSTQNREVRSTQCIHSQNICAMAHRAIFCEQSSTISLVSTPLNTSCSEYTLLALIYTFYGRSVMTRSTLPSRLSLVVISYNSVSSQSSVIYTHHTASIAQEVVHLLSWCSHWASRVLLFVENLLHPPPLPILLVEAKQLSVTIKQ